MSFSALTYSLSRFCSPRWTWQVEWWAHKTKCNSWSITTVPKFPRKIEAKSLCNCRQCIYCLPTLKASTWCHIVWVGKDTWYYKIHSYNCNIRCWVSLVYLNIGHILMFIKQISILDFFFWLTVGPSSGFPSFICCFLPSITHLLIFHHESFPEYLHGPRHHLCLIL